MEPLKKIVSRILAIPNENIDTDQIIPARFLKTTSKEGLGKVLMNDWRYDAEGRPKPDFILNRPEAAGAQILLAGGNFGCSCEIVCNDGDHCAAAPGSMLPGRWQISASGF
ncbi:MAG: hypothetical protein ACWGNK_09930 [Desulfobacterales bacterium]